MQPLPHGHPTPTLGGFSPPLAAHSPSGVTALECAKHSTDSCKEQKPPQSPSLSIPTTAARRGMCSSWAFSLGWDLGSTFILVLGECVAHSCHQREGDCRAVSGASPELCTHRAPSLSTDLTHTRQTSSWMVTHRVACHHSPTTCCHPPWRAEPFCTPLATEQLRAGG